MLNKALVLGGSGQVGKLLVDSLRATGIQTTVVDSRPPNPNTSDGPFLQTDISNSEPALTSAIRHADCVCVCLPEKIALDAAGNLAGAMPGGALWLDTLSVKRDIVHLLQRRTRDIEILSLNPMFAPALGWPGNTVAAVEAAPGPKSALFKQLLASWGARVEMLTAVEHDQFTAAIQVATHAAVLSFGAALLGTGYDLKKALRLSTPPHRLLLTLLHRIVTQNADVYWDIQAYHPLGTEMRNELIRALESIQSAVDKDEATPFTALFAELRSLLAPSGETLADWTKRCFEQLKLTADR